jgi:hypothetical protein
LPWIETLNLNDSSSELGKQFRSLNRIKTDDTMRRRILTEWKTNQNQVVNSWIELLSIKSN